MIFLRGVLFLWLMVAANAPLYAKTIKSEQFTLANGLQVVVIPNHKVPAVSHMIWYKTGSIDEPRGKSGVAHFLEHIMFKGTKTHKAGEFSEIVTENGGIENAFTSFDFTAYFQNIAVDKLPLVMELEADRMKNLVFDESEIAKEKPVILEERNMRVDNDPGSQLMEQMRALLYLHHPYGTPLIGWRHEIEALSKEDMERYYRQHYAPNNAILVVAGDMTAAQLKPLAEKYYGVIPKAASVPARPALKEPEPIAPRRIDLYDEKTKKPEFIRYYLAPTQTYGETRYAYALTVLAEILGGSETSRLYQSLVKEKGVAVATSSYYDDLGIGPSAFGVSLVLKEEKDLTAAEAALDAEIEKIVQNGITSEELSRTKNMLEAETMYSRDGFRTLAYAFGQALVIGMPASYVEEWDEKIKQVTAAEVREAARYVLQKRKSVTGILHTGGTK